VELNSVGSLLVLSIREKNPAYTLVHIKGWWLVANNWIALEIERGRKFDGEKNGEKATLLSPS